MPCPCDVNNRRVPFPDAESAFQPTSMTPERMARAEEAGYRRMLATRACEPRKCPSWVNELLRRGHKTRMEQAKTSADSEIWLHVEHERSIGIANLLNYVPIEEIPGYTPERREASLHFFQNWQNPVTGRFYDPAKTDPANPANSDDFCNEKYVIGIIFGLGGKPLYPYSAAAPATHPAGTIDPDYFLYYCKDHTDWFTGGWHAGSWAGAMALELMNAIEQGRTDLIPVLEEGLTAILAHRNRKTGLWGDEGAGLGGAIGGALKVLHRFHFYLGMENLPGTETMADTVIANIDFWFCHGGETHPCYPRNAAEMMAVCLESSDYRRDDLFFALDEMAQRYACMAGAPDTRTHEYGLGILGGYLHWRDCEIYNPKAWCHRGAAYRHRLIVQSDGTVRLVAREIHG